MKRFWQNLARNSDAEANLKYSIAAALCLIASQAAALSCMPPDLATTFNRMNEVPEDVYVLRGKLDFDESLLPQGVVNEERHPAPISGTFAGEALTREGFVSRFVSPVIVQSVCYGPWCGGVGSGEDLITFAKVVDGAVVVEVDPCGSTVFYDPTPKMESDLISCIRGETCESKER